MITNVLTNASFNVSSISDPGLNTRCDISAPEVLGNLLPLNLRSRAEKYISPHQYQKADHNSEKAKILQQILYKTDAYRNWLLVIHIFIYKPEVLYQTNYHFGRNYKLFTIFH